jgi:hypothetical protein
LEPATLEETTMQDQTPGTDPTGREPAEGRTDMGLPGADRPDQVDERTPGGGPNPGHTPDPGQPRPDQQPPDAPEADLPQKLGQRIENGPGSGGIAAGEPDLVPDVEVPKETM